MVQHGPGDSSSEVECPSEIIISVFDFFSSLVVEEYSALSLPEDITLLDWYRGWWMVKWGSRWWGNLRRMDKRIHDSSISRSISPCKSINQKETLHVFFAARWFLHHQYYHSRWTAAVVVVDVAKRRILQKRYLPWPAHAEQHAVARTRHHISVCKFLSKNRLWRWIK